jgi:hypothetical protein
MKRIITLLCILIPVNLSFAETHNLSSLNQTVVQNAINAASNGDTIILPAGVQTWTTTSGGAPAVEIQNKEISIIGAGVGQTIITDSTNAGWMETAIWIQNDTGENFRISGINFIQGVGDGNGIIKIRGNARAWRIDNCSFSASSKNMVSIGGTAVTYGLIDHCTFTAINSSNCKALQIIARTTGEDDVEPVIFGDAAWAQGLSLGTVNAVYVEDCTFTWDVRYPLVDIDEGARFVFRYNKVVGAGIGSHGHDGGYKHRGVFSYEIYENDFDANGTNLWAAIALRGGTGVIFNNTFSGNYNGTTVLYCYCACDPRVTCSAWPICEYPCPDQVGRTTGQVSSPLYLWNNTYNDGLSGPSVFNNNGDCEESANVLQEGRDFYSNTQKPGYTPYTYPHPLVSPGSQDTPPAPPTNLQIIN